MGKIADYLQEHLTGEATTAPAVLDAFSRDAGILTLSPKAVILPRTTNDVRRAARFTWRLAEKGFVVPITPRGAGSDLTGGAIGSGLIIDFPAHMGKILELDTGKRLALVQSGMNFKALNEAMATHGLWLPCFPSSFKFSTLGGALANNSGGEKSVKYGTIRDWTQKLGVVLANGEVIETGRLSKHELNQKKGQETLEGEIYRQLDGLISDHSEAIAEFAERDNGTVGYAVDKVKDDDGSFDLTPLIIGSQGTLGIITQAIVKLMPRPKDVELIAGAVNDGQPGEIIEQLRKLQPSVLDLIDGDTLELIERISGQALWKQITDNRPRALILLEFDDAGGKQQRKAKKAEQIFAASGSAIRAQDWEDKETIWSIKQCVSRLLISGDRRTAAPVATSAAVPPENAMDLLRGAREILKKLHSEGGIFGHIGAGNLTVLPLIDLTSVGGRQAVFKFMKDYFELVVKLDGTIGQTGGDGRLRAPFAKLQYGDEMAEVFRDVKQIFDPKGTLNPGVITGATLPDLVKMLDEQSRLATKFLPFWPVL
ncbi:MAG: FAD-binding oxidoreductase [Candidatus Nomurabacteria bacterium]|jgi:FAD/FMN-containing dehydrogenase|nr:FAD-binding oxidoreductase [Candidatus Nomurabacteria bacterium]